MPPDNTMCVDEDVRSLELSRVAGGHTKWFSPLENN